MLNIQGKSDSKMMMAAGTADKDPLEARIGAVRSSSARRASAGQPRLQAFGRQARLERQTVSEHMRLRSCFRSQRSRRYA